ncbi:hypothetical protein BKA70DRAFT_14163 [Coprinopsis sp. MPI-PUGE-AT-0042]|nr:hypothetical protein BKA70DRAFT_14163 [Coprinopsis sp. MPI-PUGE-AT-0042]
MSGTIMLIPQPNPLPVCTSATTLEPLRALMAGTHTKRSFKKFIEKIRKCIVEVNFPEGKTPSQAGVDIWQSLLNKVAHRCRLIRSYQNYWPVRVYINYLAYKYQALQDKRRRMLALIAETAGPSMAVKSANKQSRKPLEPGSKAPASQRKQKRPASAMANGTNLASNERPIKKARYFVGKPPPGVTGRLRYASSLELETLKSSSGALSSLTPRSSVGEACEVGEGSRLHGLTLSPSPRAIPPPTPLRLSAQAEREENLVVLVIRCPKCPWVPPISLSQTTQLQAFLNNSTHLLALRSAGLSTDAHLDLLLKWKEEDRRAFFDLIDPSEITPWDKMQILKRLRGMAGTSREDWASESNGPSHAGGSQGRGGAGEYQRSWSVWQPGRVDEELLTDPLKPISFFEEAMELGNHEMFEDVLIHIQTLAEPYLSTYFPSPAQLEETILLIARDRVVYELYEHYWPIRFYLKRLVRKLGNKPLDKDGRVLKDGLDCQDVPEKSRWKTRPSTRRSLSTHAATERLPNLHFTCPSHPLVDTRTVSQPIQAYLHYRGLHEFIPALALVGITTSEQFLEFCRLDEADKVDLFADPRVLCVTAFQKVCLKAEFSEAKVKAEGFTS